jgi:hypothetical protein
MTKVRMMYVFLTKGNGLHKQFSIQVSLEMRVVPEQGKNASVRKGSFFENMNQIASLLAMAKVHVWGVEHRAFHDNKRPLLQIEPVPVFPTPHGEFL